MILLVFSCILLCYAKNVVQIEVHTKLGMLIRNIYRELKSNGDRIIKILLPNMLEALLRSVKVIVVVPPSPGWKYCQFTIGTEAGQLSKYCIKVRMNY